MAEVLTGRVCPSGKLPVSMEQRWEDNPVFDSYYDRSKAVHKRVTYTEGVFVGYRGYDRNGVAPRYPFGYGLSYTTFSYSNLTVEPLGGSRVRVAFDVANTGKVDGRRGSAGLCLRLRGVGAPSGEGVETLREGGDSPRQERACGARTHG